jgi:ABC-type multidrug transport system permease subunit
MAKPIITLNGLKIVIMLGMLVIILTGVRLQPTSSCPLFWRCLLR